MKSSKYNYFLPLKDGRTLIFNGLTHRFFTASEKNIGRIRSIIENPDEDARKHYESFLNKMLEDGFVIADETDEHESIRNLYEQKRNPNHYFLLVLPTYACNLRCWYCTQKHADVIMTDETAEKLKKHIVAYLESHPEVKSLYLCWFGGEPMLCFNRIEEINSFAMKCCEEHGIHFSSGITTNSTLIDREKIKRLRDLRVWHYQITIDGYEQTHNNTKVFKGGNSYKRSLSNIRQIVELIPEVDCILRVNYSPENLDAKKIMDGINEEIPENLRGRIRVLLRKIWQIDDRDIDPRELGNLEKGVKDSGFIIGNNGLGMCYVNFRHFNSVFPDGTIGRCDNMDMTETKGHFDENGEIVRTGYYDFEKLPPLYEGTVCSSCMHFPICFGPCPKSVDEMIRTYGDVRCAHDDPQKRAEEYIRHFTGYVEK